jgi:hypothetical protein
MKAWQRKIREKEAQKDPRPVVGLENAIVVEIAYEKAREIVLRYEWLGTWNGERSFGLILNGELAGVFCFGKTAGTATAKSVCGESWAQYVVTLCRGACCHWAHPHSGSYLISAACRQMANSARTTKSGRVVLPAYIFVAYSDTDAGEIGTVYQACNWLYCGKTSGTTMYRDVTGQLRDSKLIHSAIRSRKGRSARPDATGRRFFIRDGKKFYAGDTLPDGTVVGGGNKLYPYIPLSTRAERKKQLVEQKVAFEKGKPKHRYVGIYAPNRRIKRAILQALRWQTFPYPKREVTPSKASGLDAGSSLAAPVGSASDATLPSLTRPRSVLWDKGASTAGRGRRGSR